MSLAITELELTEVSTITIPTDAIIMLSILIIFALLGYFFHKILNTQTNKFIQKVDDHSNLQLVKEKLEDQLIVESKTVDQERKEKRNITKLNFLPPSRLFRLSSIAAVAIGGASLLGIQAMQNSYQEVKTSQVNIKSKKQPTGPFISMGQLKSLNRTQNKIKKINYIDPLLAAINSSKNNNFSQFRISKTEDFFSF